MYAVVDPMTGKLLPVKGVDNGDGTSSLDTAIGGTAITLGQKTSALSLPVVFSSDQSQMQACKVRKDQIILENNSGCIIRMKPNA